MATPARQTGHEGPDSRNRGQAVLSAGNSRGRRRHHRGRNRHQQAHALQSFSVQGRADLGLSGAALRGARGRRTSRRSSRFSAPSIRWSGALRQRIFAAARSSTRWPNSARTGRSARSPSPSRKAAASGFATCWCSSASPIAEALATQLALLVDGSIAQDLVRDDPAMARAAKEAATVLLRNAGVKIGGSVREQTRWQNASKPAS